jgi:hypothetical protein
MKPRPTSMNRTERGPNEVRSKKTGGTEFWVRRSINGNSSIRNPYNPNSVKGSTSTLQSSIPDFISNGFPKRISPST